MTWTGLIWTQARGGVIGSQGGMPWHVPEDLAHFRKITRGSPVVMGRRTWDSLPERFRPLPERENIVITRNRSWQAEGAVPVEGLAPALVGRERAWIIGGGEIYAEALADADQLEVTELDLEVDGDTYAPSTQGWRCIEASDWGVSRSGVPYRFLTYQR